MRFCISCVCGVRLSVVTCELKIIAVFVCVIHCGIVTGPL